MEQKRPAFLIPEPNAPFALPASFRNSLQRWIQAVSVVTDVAVITEKQPSWVCSFPTGFTYRALQAPPAFTKHHFSNLQTARWKSFELCSVKYNQCKIKAWLRSAGCSTTHTDHITSSRFSISEKLCGDPLSGNGRNRKKLCGVADTLQEYEFRMSANTHCAKSTRRAVSPYDSQCWVFSHLKQIIYWGPIM